MSLDVRRTLPAVAPSHGRAFLLLDAHQAHGLEVHESKSSLPVTASEEAIAMAHMCSTQLKEEVSVANTFRVKDHSFLTAMVFSNVSNLSSNLSIHSRETGWTVSRPPHWVVLPDLPSQSPSMFMGTSRTM